VDIEVTESGLDAAPSTPRHPLGRRALLGVGLGGAAMSLLPFLSGRASATTPVEESTTTGVTTPPQRPTDPDVELLAVVQQVELTALALYNEALALSGWTDEHAVVITFIRQAHLAYGQSLSGLLGRRAPGVRSEQLFDELRGDFAGSVESVLAAAYALEASLAVTHGEVLAELQGTDAAALIASIQMNEARFGTVLADMAGMTDEADLLVEADAESLAGKV